MGESLKRGKDALNWQNTHCNAFWKTIEIALQKLVGGGGGLHDCMTAFFLKLTRSLKIT